MAKKNKKEVSPIAIIGLGCQYPGAKNPKELWENILSRRQQFRQMPDCRLPLSEYYAKDKNAPDKTYGDRAAVIDGYEFDWAKKRIPKTVYDSTDIVHWLALDIAEQAILDAGYTKDTLAKDKTGVIIGNTLTGEFSRSNTMRLRWPYVRKVFRSIALEKGFSNQEILELEKKFEAQYKSVFALITEDSLAGGLSNTIAGRVCNFFDLHGGGYTVDGACSSSLLAVIHAATALANGDMDVALAGGVDISLDTFELIGFAKTGALTDKDMTVYDEAGSGFIPGEGCGFVILKRLADAQKAGDKIYAVLKGWGISSDGKGGITAPTAKGQSLALNRAYEKANCSPLELDFIEGHGTGTAVGDQIELQGIALTLDDYKAENKRFCGVTSLKSIIGHAKAAAGVGAFIKSVMAVNQRVLPPTAGCKNPHPVFGKEGKNLFPILQGKVEPAEKTIRAGVSAMGFGGINSHVTLESGNEVYDHLKSELSAEQLMASNQETELFVLSANHPEELKAQVTSLNQVAQGISLAEMADMASELSQKVNPQALLKFAIVCSKPAKLIKATNLFAERLNHAALTPGVAISQPQEDLFFSYGIHKTDIGFLFPGQGSQKLNMATTLIQRFGWAKEIAQEFAQGTALLDTIYCPTDQAQDQTELDTWFKELSRTDNAQLACTLSDVLWFEYLLKLNIQPVAVAGHSLGELPAFYAAKIFSRRDLINFTTLRGQAMAELQAKGTMVSLKCNLTEAENLIKQLQDYAVIANINSPTQIIVSGTKEGINELTKLAKEKNIAVYPLPVANAFHSDLMKEAANRVLKEADLPKEYQEPEMKLFSGKTAGQINSGLNLAQYFHEQMLSQVRFTEMMGNFAKHCKLILEVGTGNVLSRLAQEILPHGPLCLPVEAKPSDDRSLNICLAQAFINGVEINWTAFYENRLTRPFIPASQKQFIQNPLERPLANETAKLAEFLQTEVLTKDEVSQESLSPKDQQFSSIEESLLELAAKRTGFAKNSLNLDLRILDDLNMDSIKSAELVASAARIYNLNNRLDPSQFANARLSDIAAALQQLVAQYGTQDGLQETPRKSWVRYFGESWVLSSNSEVQSPKLEFGDIAVLGLEDILKTDLKKLNKKHLLLTLNPIGINEYREVLTQLHAVSHITSDFSSLTFLILNTGRNNGAYIQSFAASLHHENPEIKVRVLAFAGADLEEAKTNYLAELENPDKFINAYYDTKYQKYVPQHLLLDTRTFEPRQFTWAESDVILVTGGAKGITAACALAFAQKTKAKMILLGSSKIPEANDKEHEINKTLNQYQSQGLNAVYFSCDITNFEALSTLCQQIDQEMGTITGIIHGAGANMPRLAKTVSLEDALKEVSPKLQGAINLTKVFQGRNLKLFVGFTSIIGVTGMPGNAWYAFSNETVKVLLDNFAKQNPKTQTQALAFSIWDEIGMGAHLGSVRQLAKKGIGAIPPQEGELVPKNQTRNRGRKKASSGIIFL